MQVTLVTHAALTDHSVRIRVGFVTMFTAANMSEVGGLIRDDTDQALNRETDTIINEQLP